MPDARAADRPIEWATQTLTQGEILDAFARHCREELDDVEVVDAGPGYLVARWRQEESRLECRLRLAADQLPAGDQPTMLLGDLEAEVMELIWSRPPDQGTTVRDVFEILYAPREFFEIHGSLLFSLPRMADS